MVRILVPVHQRTFYVGSPVQNPAAYLDIGQYAVVSVILKAPAADLQSDGQFLVGVIAFPVQGRLVVFTYFLHLFRKVFQRREESSHAHVVFRCQQPDIAIVIHKSDICLFVGWLVGWFVGHIAYSFLAGCYTPFHFRHGKDGLHVLRPVIYLVVYFGVSQRSVLPHRLQGSRADAEQPAHVIAVKPLLFSQVLLFPAEPFHLFRENLESREHSLESRLVYDYYFHIPVILSSFDIDFSYKTKRRNQAVPTVSCAKETKKRKQSANQTTRVTVRHPFSPQEDNCRR